MQNPYIPDMIRETIFKTPESHHSREGFRLRGQDIKRIETLSDAVFAFAVTLLIVSLEVPKTFEELLTSMRGFLAFALCFALLMMVWHEQHVYFRRYALDDKLSLLLNAALLFIILFYVYPLKFLFSLLFSDRIYGHEKNPFSITQDQVPQLMTIYGLGYIAIYSIFFLLYWHALRKRHALQLNHLEIFDTRTKMYAQLILVAVGMCSVFLAMILPSREAGISGMFYFAILPAFWVVHARRAAIRKRIK
jgi:uncharacterized membrane protein